MRSDKLTMADKDLIREFLAASKGRVLNGNTREWPLVVPQGVSVFVAHPKTCEYEYMYTKSDRYPVVMDKPELVNEQLNRYGDVRSGGLVLYMHTCMVKLASKHQKYCY